MSVNEGNTIQYTVNTARVTDGTTLYWRTTGSVNYGLCGPPQIIGSNNGTITVTNNQAVFNVSLNLNQYIDSTRTLGIGLSTTQWGPIVGATAQQITINDTSKTHYTVNYLLVGGGGAGGTGYNAGLAYGGGGGGGAGGVIQGNTLMSIATTYTITVGGGGAAANKTCAYTAVVTNSGANSTIISSNPIESTITAYGGGGGGISIETYRYPLAWQGQPGGSGGGAGINSCFGLGIYNEGLAIGSPDFNRAGSQGYPGGQNGISGYGGCYAPFNSAGGGGASSHGCSGLAPQGGAGGNGYTWPITTQMYAAGGSGGTKTAGNRAPGSLACHGGGGYGGGGIGLPGAAGNGTPTSGGGGGGAGVFCGNGPTVRGGNGGAGIVILAIPLSSYPGAYGPISSTPPAAPGKVVLTFTSSGTYTA